MKIVLVRSVEIIDMAVRLIQNFDNLSHSNSVQMNLDLTKNGLYFVRLTSNDHQIVKKYCVYANYHKLKINLIFCIFERGHRPWSQSLVTERSRSVVEKP
ncbi:MAG: T9SS type A sorting domain-containing protein [Winogradskyella sp.]|uniref:T9SS type A sorting domain-containing protein n=1 Tax=Winogradskyella sp. TaxID=1883156 RepID=UPI00183346BA|nr:T9SS type A sorting domain-containing protein [Winogradskyella sp.]MBT8243687.1 T9SS type A sorting domain-containing protein [Winogradskyella sp.]NNK23283.1 T9SS type A sorting domain-containing protein [Winogradskyella sp.]